MRALNPPFLIYLLKTRMGPLRAGGVLSANRWGADSHASRRRERKHCLLHRPR